MYVFEESTRRYAINRKGQGRKEVIYLRVADVSCTRGVRESTGVTDLINRIVQVLRGDLYWVKISAQEAGLMEPVKP